MSTNSIPAEESDAASLRVILENGFAEHMGEGLFILFQEVDGKTHSLVLSVEDLQALLAHTTR